MSAPACHVYIVAAKEIPAAMPRGACRACGKPLSGHEKRVSGLIPDDCRAVIIDEKLLDASFSGSGGESR